MSTQPHILVADDERSIRLMLETGLALNGFRVTCARTGREALELPSRPEQFDAVLSDIYMPDGGGLELVDSLRAINPNLPIMLMTAQGSLEVAVQAVAARRQRFYRQAVRYCRRGGAAAPLSGRAPRSRRLRPAAEETESRADAWPAWWAAARP